LNVIDVAAEVLQTIQPTTVRSVAYKLFGRGITTSMKKSEVNRVGRALKAARETGRIRWEWIVDDGREEERIASWADPEAFANDVIAQYKRDRWAMQPRRVEIWSEKSTVYGVLQPILRKYGVTFRSFKGFTSATSIHDVAIRSLYDDPPVDPLYLGDWDPSGLYMSEVDIPARLVKYGAGDRLAITRLAITEPDTRTGLPWFSVETKKGTAGKKGDPRYRWFKDRYGDRCFELDALDPVLLRSRVEDAILSRIDLELWQRSDAAEAAEHESLVAVLSRWPTISKRESEYDGGRP